jgi:hypothetical protein
MKQEVSHIFQLHTVVVPRGLLCISFRDNVFVMDYVMCQACNVFDLETTYYVEICTTYYLTCELCFHVL